MKLYFMRHGHAEAAMGKPDEERALTPEGVKRVENAAVVIKRLKITPVHIYCSPRVRAYQTAEIVAQALGVPIEVREEVNFGFSEKAVKDLTVGLDGTDFMFVGHEPTMSQTIAAVTQGSPVTMKPGSFARVDVSSQQNLRGELVWLIAPKVFDAISRA